MSEVLWSMVKYYKADESCKILTNISEWLTGVIKWLNKLGQIERDWKLIKHYKYK
jgi:hypothetical protein